MGRRIGAGSWMLLALAVGCVPVETIEVPDGIDWVAFLGTSGEPFEPGRLYSARQAQTLVRTSTGGWLLGFSQGTLLNAQIPREAFGRVFIRSAGDRERPFPAPDWFQSFESSNEPPRITTDWALLPTPDLELETLPNFVATVSHAAIDLPPENRYGHSLFRVSNQASLLLIDNAVLSVSLSGINLVGRHSCPNARTAARFKWPDSDILNYHLAGPSHYCYGRDLNSLTATTSDDPSWSFDGAFFIAPGDQPLFITASGVVQQRVIGFREDESQQLSASNLMDIVATDDAVFAASHFRSFTPWGLIWNGSSTNNGIHRSPFELFEDTVVFVGFPSGLRSTSFVPSSIHEPFAADANWVYLHWPRDMARYKQWLLVLGGVEESRIWILNRFGALVSHIDLAGRPLELITIDDSILAITVSRSAPESETAIVSAYILTPDGD